MSDTRFLVIGSFTLSSVRLFALRGQIVAGKVIPGMLVQFNVNPTFGISAPIVGVEFVDTPGTGESSVALTFRYKDESERILEEFAPQPGETCEVHAPSAAA